MPKELSLIEIRKSVESIKDIGLMRINPIAAIQVLCDIIEHMDKEIMRLRAKNKRLMDGKQ